MQYITCFDVICKRVLSFAHTCVNSDSVIVSYMSRYALLHGRMSSPLGRTVVMHFIVGYGMDSMSAVYSVTSLILVE